MNCLLLKISVTECREEMKSAGVADSILATECKAIFSFLCRPISCFA